MPSAAEVPMIEVEHLTVGYGDTVVLEDLDFTVPRGDVFAILGGSGRGKSTLLRALIGLEEPMRGTVRIAGAPPAREGPPRYGVLFQSGALFGSMTLAENVALPLAKWTSLDRDAIHTIVRSKLRLVGREGFENHLPPPTTGSSGCSSCSPSSRCWARSSGSARGAFIASRSPRSATSTSRCRGSTWARRSSSAASRSARSPRSRSRPIAATCRSLPTYTSTR